MGELRNIALSEIKPNQIALRQVDVESEEVVGLIQSIKECGVLTSISVRLKTDQDSGEEFYELIDGLHRYTASIEAGLSEIPAQIMALDDAQVLEAQVIANVQKVETKAAAYSKQLRRILNFNPMMTMGELASKLGKSEKWVGDRLSLNKITNESVKTLIDDGQISLSNAYALAKLPEDEQENFIEQAMTDDPQVFIPAVNDRVKEIRDANRQGADAAPAEYSPVARLQKLSAFKEAREDGGIASALLSKTGVTDPKEAFQLALDWALHLDPISVEDGRAKWEVQQAEKKDRAKKRAKDKAEKKAAKAKEAADKAIAEAGAV